MNRNINHVFKAEDLDWKQLETIGIGKKQLEKDGSLELLLQGEETNPVPLKIRTPILLLTMDAILNLAEGPDGKPVMEINGLKAEENA